MKVQQFLLMSLFALLPIGYVIYEEKLYPNLSAQILPHQQQEFKVSAVKVLTGNSFEVLVELSNGQRQWLRGSLPKQVISGADDVVVEILNKSSEPTVILREKVNLYDGSYRDMWIIDIILMHDGKRVSLLDLLLEKELVLY